MQFEPSREIAQKVLRIVDAGLSPGLGNPIPGQMCVEAAVCYAFGLPHGDNPPCVARYIRDLKILLNDSMWENNAARAQGLRRLAIAQLGTNTFTEAQAIALRDTCARVLLRTFIPQFIQFELLRTTPTPSQKDLLLEVARRCETIDVSAIHTLLLQKVHFSPHVYGALYNSIHGDFSSVPSFVAAYYGVIRTQANKLLSDLAEGVVQILIDMKSPGSQWLDLTE